jgi:hypothetical protein
MMIMKQLTTLAIVSGLWLVLVLGCNVSENKSRSEPPTSSPAASTTSSNTVAEIDRVLGIPAGFSPIYKVLEMKDVSTATASRKVINLSLPKGTDKAAIENNLKYAAKELYEKEKPDAIEVFGYLEGRTIDSSNVMGRLTFAPYGDWARASERPSLDKYKAVFKERNPYLPPLDEEAQSSNSPLEKQALAGDYQAQRNLAYYLSTGAEGYPTNPVMGCAWRIVILKSGSSKVDDSDRSNKTFDCDQKLNPRQLREAEAQVDILLKKIRKR